MSERTFSSLDFGENIKQESVYRSGIPPGGTPIDLEAINTIQRIERLTNDYVPRESSLEKSLEVQRKAATANRAAADYAETQARNLLIQEREQAQRQQINNRVATLERPRAQGYPIGIDPPPTVTTPTTTFQTEDLQQYMTRQPRPSAVRPPPIDSVALVPFNQENLQQYMTRQPRPSAAALPITPNTSGAVVNVGPTARPSSAIPRSPTPPINPATGAKPNSLPKASGISPRGLYTGVLVSTAFRIASGQPVDQALFGATAETIGSVIGATGGSFFGPVGTFLGGIAGGMIGGNIADQIYGLARPKNAALPTNLTKIGVAPFTGGQSSASYNLDVWYFNPGDNRVVRDIEVYGILGPIGGVRYTREKTAHGHDILTPNGWQAVSRRTPISDWSGTEIRNVRRSDGQIDTGGDPMPSPVAKDVRTPISTQHPGNTDFAIPSAEPESRKQNVGVDNYVPGSTANKTSGNKRGDSPDRVSHGGLKGTPHPDNMPQPLMSPLPVVEAARVPLPFADPEDYALPGLNNQPVNGTFTVPNPLPLSDPDGGSIVLPFAPIVPSTVGVPVTPVPIHAVGSPFDISQLDPANAIPAPIPAVGQALNTPDSNKPAPITTGVGTGPVPAPTPEFTPAAPAPVTQPQLLPLQNEVTNLGIGLAGLTVLIQGLLNPVNQIAANTTPQNLKQAAKDGTCETVEPGGCLLPLANNAQTAANNSTVNGNKLDNLGNLASIGDAGVGADTNLRVRNLEDKVGAHEYPMILPEYLTDDSVDTTVTILNQVRFNEWILKQIDALFGQFPIKIEHTDEDGKKEMLTFENLGEAIAELTGMIAQVAFDADTAVNVGTHATAEAIGAKTAALQAGSYLKAIVDYMGFQGQPVSIDIPVSVTPGAVGLDGKLQENELKDFLKPSVQKAIGFKNTDPIDQRLTLRRILESGEISRAALYRPLKSDASKNSLTGDAITADKKAEKKRIDDAWEKFKLRMEGHTGGTKVDIDDGNKPEPGFEGLS